MAVDRFMGDVQPAAIGETVELTFRQAPGKFRTCLGVIDEIRHHGPVPRCLRDSGPARGNRLDRGLDHYLCELRDSGAEFPARMQLPSDLLQASC